MHVTPNINLFVYPKILNLGIIVLVAVDIPQSSYKTLCCFTPARTEWATIPSLVLINSLFKTTMYVTRNLYFSLTTLLQNLTFWILIPIPMNPLKICYMIFPSLFTCHSDNSTLTGVLVG